jgi:hypothetical protein
MVRGESAAACSYVKWRFFRRPDCRGPLLKGARAAAFLGIVSLASREAVSTPAIFVEKTVSGGQTKIVISGSALPEMRGIAFACTYSVSAALIMDAILASPQPATALSVLVDTSKSSILISVRAASTLLPAENAGLVEFKMSAPVTGGSWPLTVTKATVTDKQGAVAEIPVTVKASVMENGPPAADCALRHAPFAAGSFYAVNGRKLVGGEREVARGMYLNRRGSAGSMKFTAFR